eukprot:jgi/Chrzof1/6858/Cz02g01050.t1
MTKAVILLVLLASAAVAVGGSAQGHEEVTTFDQLRKLLQFGGGNGGNRGESRGNSGGNSGGSFAQQIAQQREQRTQQREQVTQQREQRTQQRQEPPQREQRTQQREEPPQREQRTQQREEPPQREQRTQQREEPPQREQRTQQREEPPQREQRTQQREEPPQLNREEPPQREQRTQQREEPPQREQRTQQREEPPQQQQGPPSRDDSKQQGPPSRDDSKQQGPPSRGDDKPGNTNKPDPKQGNNGNRQTDRKVDDDAPFSKGQRFTPPKSISVDASGKYTGKKPTDVSTSVRSTQYSNQLRNYLSDGNIIRGARYGLEQLRAGRVDDVYDGLYNQYRGGGRNNVGNWLIDTCYLDRSQSSRFLGRAAAFSIARNDNRFLRDVCYDAFTLGYRRGRDYIRPFALSLADACYQSRDYGYYSYGYAFADCWADSYAADALAQATADVFCSGNSNYYSSWVEAYSVGLTINRNGCAVLVKAQTIAATQCNGGYFSSTSWTTVTTQVFGFCGLRRGGFSVLELGK